MKRELLKLHKKLTAMLPKGYGVSVSCEFADWFGDWRYAAAVFFLPNNNECHVSGSCVTTDEVFIKLEAEYAEYLHTKQG